MLIHWIWYATLSQLSLRQKVGLLEHFSDPEEIFYAQSYSHIPQVSDDMAKALTNKDLTQAQQVLKHCAEKHISILTFSDTAYPSRLRNIEDPPLVLYYKGVLPDFEGQPLIAVVGTRKASTYGITNARHMAAQIAACGGLVVSGGAYGIDTAAHQGALEAGKQTVAVLGCGADVVYPRSNRRLFAQIEQNGCLLSEYLPGTEPKPWQFPERNRILSGMSSGVLIVEAPERSGALITARKAFEQGRDVFVVPGNIDVATCAGSNALLQDCAAAVFSGWDAVKEYAPQYPGVVENRPIQRQVYNEAPTASRLKVAQTTQTPKHADKKDIDNPKSSAYSVLDNESSQLNQEEKQIVACLNSTPRPVDEVIAQMGMPAGKVLSALTKLALKGVVINHPGRLVSARKR